LDPDEAASQDIYGGQPSHLHQQQRFVTADYTDEVPALPGYTHAGGDHEQGQAVSYGHPSSNHRYQTHSPGRDGVYDTGNSHLNYVPEESWSIREPLPGDDDRLRELRPSAEPARHRHTSRKARPAYDPDNDASYEVIEGSPYATTPRFFRRRHGSTRSSASLDHDSANNIVQQRKKFLHGETGATADYWEWDATQSRYFYQHADGAVTWAEDEYY